MTITSQGWAADLLTYWFGPLNDETKLDSNVEPFRAYMQRWYGKEPEIDRHIRERFEPALLSVTGSWCFKRAR